MQQRPPYMAKRLVTLKKQRKTLRNRSDLVWHLLLGSFATMGGSRGWKGLTENPKLLESVSYAALAKLTATDRLQRLEQALHDAKVRMPPKKAAWLAENFLRIQKRGGVEAVTKAALALTSQEEKIRFMRGFKGIGPKYARDVWMDIYDPSFHDTIAVDARIKRLTKALGYEFSCDDEYETFYKGVAAEVGLEPWELDRLLYNFNDCFMGAIET